jgi:hypothetical protein
MSAYNSYLKRVNKYGDNLQDRIQNKKEHDFLTFMMKSPNLVRAYKGDTVESFDAVLQTKTYDQDEVVDYLLVPVGTDLPLGSIISTEDSRHKTTVEGEILPLKRIWINYSIDPYTSGGYDRHTVVEMKYTMNWVQEGIRYSSLCYGVSAGGSGKSIGLVFKTQFSESGVYLPNKRFNVIMPAHSAIKKNQKVSLGGEIWRVTGFDNISVPGVSYITLEETLVDEQDKNLVDENDFYNWSVSTNFGENFVLSSGSENEIELTFYYNEKERKDVKFSILEDENFEASIVSENKISLKINDNFVGNSSIKLHLEGWEEKIISIPFSAAARIVETIAIVGPKTIYMGDTTEFSLENLSQAEFESVTLSNENAKITGRDWDNKKIKVYGQKIGKSQLKVLEEGTDVEVTFDLEVLSAWLRGGK